MRLFTIQVDGSDNAGNKIEGILNIRSKYKPDDEFALVFYSHSELKESPEKAKHKLTFFTKEQALSVCNMIQKSADLISSVSLNFTVVVCDYDTAGLSDLAVSNCDNLGIHSEEKEVELDW